MISVNKDTGLSPSNNKTENIMCFVFLCLRVRFLNLATLFYIILEFLEFFHKSSINNFGGQPGNTGPEVENCPTFFRKGDNTNKVPVNGYVR